MSLLQLELTLLQLLLLLRQEVLDRLELAILPVDQLELLVKQVATLLDLPLLLAEALACFLHLAVKLVPAPQHVLLGLEFRLHANGFGRAVGVGEDLVGKPTGRLGTQPAHHVGPGDSPQRPHEEPDHSPDHRSVHGAARPFQIRHSTRLARWGARRHGTVRSKPGAGTAAERAIDRAQTQARPTSRLARGNRDGCKRGRTGTPAQQLTRPSP